MLAICFFFSRRRRHTRCALVTGVQTCALPISTADAKDPRALRVFHMSAPEHAAVDVADRAVLRDDVATTAPTPQLEADQTVADRALEGDLAAVEAVDWREPAEIGRASCRERVCQSVYLSVVARALNTSKNKRKQENVI